MMSITTIESHEPVQAPPTRRRDIILGVFWGMWLFSLSAAALWLLVLLASHLANS